jgi:hypothetical protein
LVASVIGLAALASMMLNGFMKTMIRSRNAALTIVISAGSWCASGEEQKSRQCRAGQRYFSGPKDSRLQFCLHPVLLYFELRPNKQGYKEIST